MDIISQESIVATIEAFIKRQRIALLLIQEKHPDFLLLEELQSASHDRITYILEELRSYSDVPSQGIWGNWEYTFHGGGCIITALEGGETINFEGNNEYVFDVWSLIYWMISVHIISSDIDKREFYSQLMAEINNLTNRGTLTHKKDNKFTLISDKS